MAKRQKPELETKTVSEARRTFSETLNRVYRGETRVLIEKNGIPVGGMVSAADLELLGELDARSERAIKAFETMQQAFADVPEEELERELAKALTEAKEIQRQKGEPAPKKSA